MVIWQAIRHLMNLKMKLKYALELRRSSYLGGLSAEEQDVSDDTAKQMRQNVTAFSLMSALFPCYLSSFGWSSVMATGRTTCQTRRQDMFQNFCANLVEVNFSNHILASVPQTVHKLCLVKASAWLGLGGGGGDSFPRGFYLPLCHSSASCVVNRRGNIRITYHWGAFA
jgi:hypothetical protein